MPWSIAAAATSSGTPSGTRTSRAAGATTALAYEPGADAHATRSPDGELAHVGTDGLDPPAPSRPAHERQRPRVEAGAEVDVDEVHAGGRDADAHLAGPRGSGIAVAEGQDFGATEFFDDDRFRHLRTIATRLGERSHGRRPAGLLRGP